MGFLTRQILKADKKNKKVILNLLRKHDSGSFHKVLDCGCDDGSLLTEIRKAVHVKDCYGVEIDPVQADKARSKGIKVHVCDLNDNLPFESESFDLIISNQVIEHLTFSDNHLFEVMRLLKPGGLFVLSTPNLASLHHRLFLLFGVQPMVLNPSWFQTFPLNGKNPKYGHKSVFTYGSLKSVMKRHRFVFVDCLGHYIYFLPRFLSGVITWLFPSCGVYSVMVVGK